MGQPTGAATPPAHMKLAGQGTHVVLYGVVLYWPGEHDTTQVTSTVWASTTEMDETTMMMIIARKEVNRAEIIGEEAFVDEGEK